MISRLRGKVLSKDFEGAVIDVHGIGFRVAMPMTSLEQLPGQGEEADLYTYMAVRDDAIELFGFNTEGDRKVFLKLIGVSGIGPRLGLSFLSGMTATELVAAVVRGDVRALTSIKGVGKKTAERLVLEVKDSLTKIDLGSPVLPGGAPVSPSIKAANALEDLRSALGNLGYPPALVDRAVNAVAAKGDDQGFNDMLREALKVLRG